jgi:uncharacterized protein YkwD
MRSPNLAVGLLAAALVLPAAQAAAHAPPTPRPGPEASRADRAATVQPRSDRWEAKVLKLTNARRTAHGRKPLKANRCADGFAESWTRHMAAKQVLRHQPLDPFFSCPHTTSAGENIAYGYETPRALVSAWMHSEGHRANILSRHFHRIGVAGWRATNGQTYATQDFLGG